MTTVTDEQAYDEIQGVVQTTWDAGIAALVGATANELRFKGAEKTAPATGFWGFVYQQIVAQVLASFSDQDTFGQSKRRYRTFGNAIVQVWAPKGIYDAHRIGRAISSMLRDGFRAWGQQGNVIFLNMQYTSLPDDGQAYRWNVTAEFEYDTIR